MSGEIIDTLTTIVAFIAQHYIVILTITAVLVFVLDYVVVLLLVRSCGKQEPWRSALESWNKARRKWKRARASLRQATWDLKRAVRQTRKRPKGAMAVAKGESEEKLRELQNQKQTAWREEARTYKRVREAREQVDAAGREVHEAAYNRVKCKLKFYRTATGKLWKTILKFAESTCCAFKSVTAWTMKHHPLIAGVILTLVALAYDYFYYSRFNFNILAFYSDTAGGTLIMVVSVVFAVTVALLVFLTTVIFSIFVILSVVLFLVISLVWVVVFVLGLPSAWTLGIYRRSVRLSQLTLLLASTWAGFLKVFQDFLNSIDQKVDRLIEKITGEGFRNRIGKTTVRAVWLLFIILTIPALVYVAFIEPQYRAQHAYRGDNRVRVVVNQPPDGGADPMIKIGSNRSYLFAVPVESRSTGAAGGCARTTASEQKRDDGNVEIQSGWIEVVVKSFRDRIHFFWSNLLSENGAAFKISEDEGPLRKFLCKLWLSVQGPLEFVFNFRPPDFKGAVIALPPPRVHCVYEEGSDQAAKLCAPAASDGEEWLLREQLARKIGCQQPLIVSKPFVFMPGEWKDPKDGVEAQVEEFRRKCCTSLQKASKRILYVVGFASADGPGNHNRKLALNRAQTIQCLIRKKFPGWRICTRSLGEDHLTSGVAHSRSARLVFCAGQQGG